MKYLFQLQALLLFVTPCVFAHSLVPVARTNQFPYSAVGKFEHGCTGALIGPRHVLTAGHCVYHDDDRRWTDDLIFTPGQNRNAGTFGKAKAAKVLIPSSWKASNDESFDYALVILDTALGNKTGWLGFGVDSALKDNSITIVGYPATKTDGTLWKSECPFLKIFPQWLDYECQTEEGMSGSPIIRFLYETNNNLIVGIHAMGGSEYNSGVRINSRVYNQLMGWKKQYP